MTPAQNAATTWRMVPVEPTPEMCAALLSAVSDITVEIPEAAAWNCLRGYRAMLAAAPKPPETIAQRQAREVMNPGFGFAVQSAPAGQSYNAAAPAVVSEGQEDRVKMVASALCHAAGMDPDGAARSGYSWINHRKDADAVLAALARAGGDGWRGTFNVNNYVWIKLTDAGRAYHRQWYTDRYPTLAYRVPDEGLGGWSKWQLWSLMQEFGPAMYMGGRMPFEAGIRFAAPDAGEDGRG